MFLVLVCCSAGPDLISWMVHDMSSECAAPCQLVKGSLYSCSTFLLFCCGHILFSVDRLSVPWPLLHLKYLFILSSFHYSCWFLFLRGLIVYANDMPGSIGSAGRPTTPRAYLCLSANCPGVWVNPTDLWGHIFGGFWPCFSRFSNISAAFPCFSW